MSDLISEEWIVVESHEIHAKDGEEYKIDIRKNPATGKFDARCWKLVNGVWTEATSFPWVLEDTASDAWSSAQRRLREMLSGM